MAAQPGLFDVDERLHRLTDLGDQLNAYAVTVDFKLFQPELKAALCCSDGTKGGRPTLRPGAHVQDRGHSSPERSLRRSG